MPITVHSIYRHPLKGLTPEAMDSVELSPGQAIANDRRFALALGSTPTETAATEWLPKTSFLMLARHERLAQLETRFDDETETLSVLRQGKQVARGKLTDRIGRTTIEEFFAAFMKDESRGRPKVVEAADGHVLSDHNAPVISILNLASAKDLERVTQKPVDPLRFRANIWIEGTAPWHEFEWIDKQITIGGATLTVTARIDRCAATNVNPATAERDLNIPKALQMGYRHVDFGVYARVDQAGTVKPGDTLVSPT
ncbi:MAG: MOSC domain-containing protein [Magnetovibrio sp.]|nr:MOSC domain-containing protein [Magnetovibrio sp.]